MLSNNWIFLATMAMLITGLSILGLKMMSESNYDNNLILALTFIVMGIFSIFYLIYNKNKTSKFIEHCNYKLFIYILIFSIILILNNYILNVALKNTPNIAYTHMIVNLNIIFSLLAGYFLFKQNINFKCFIGILIALVGILIIIFNK